MAQKGSPCPQPPTRCRLAASATSSWRGGRRFHSNGLSKVASKHQLEASSYLGMDFRTSLGICLRTTSGRTRQGRLMIQVISGCRLSAHVVYLERALEHLLSAEKLLSSTGQEC